MRPSGHHSWIMNVRALPRVEMRFCHLTTDGVSKHRRKIDAPAWAEVATNYSQHVRHQVEALVSLSPHPAPRRISGRGPLAAGAVGGLRELVRPDAKNASGQALSRLLNLTDAMVGQGLRL